MTIVHPRADWTTRAPRRRTALTRSRVKYVVIHYPGSATTFGTKANVPANLRGWQNYHMDKRGWSDIAYNEAVDQKGEVWLLRGDYVDGSVANMGGSVYSILAVLGNNETPSDAMLATIRERALMHQKRMAAGCKIVGHRDLKSTSCPGGKLHAWIWKGLPAPVATPEPAPAPEPEPKPSVPVLVAPPKPAEDLNFRLGVCNLQLPRFGGSTDYAARGRFMKERMRCSVYLLSESDSDMRDAIRKELGPTWKTYPLGGVAVMWDGAKWLHDTDPKRTSFGTAYHGAIRVTLRRRDRRVDFIALHTRPGAIASLTTKQGDIREAASLRRSFPLVIGGDFATGTAEAVLKPLDITRATPNVDTMDAAGVQRVDAAFIKGLKVRSAQVVDPGKLSDHKWLIASLTLPSNISTL